MNEVIIVCIISWALAQTFKLPIYYLRKGEWNPSIMLSTGSMPSSHTAIVVAMALEVGSILGYDSPEFGIGFVIAGIIIHDAVKVRGESGKQAQIINQLLDAIDIHIDAVKRQEKLKELIGHTVSEVIGGFLVGASVVFVYNLF